MRDPKHYLDLVKLAEAAAARTESPVARNYWTGVAEKNRRLADEAPPQRLGTQRPKKNQPAGSV